MLLLKFGLWIGLLFVLLNNNHHDSAIHMYLRIVTDIPATTDASFGEYISVDRKEFNVSSAN